jgi:hypothetical protein
MQSFAVAEAHSNQLLADCGAAANIVDGHSCSLAVVRPQQSAKPFPANCHSIFPANFSSRNQQPIVHPLMVALPKIRIHKVSCGSLERFLSKENHPIQALFFQASHKPLDDRILPRTGRRNDNFKG